MNVNVLVIGSGGREHALSWKIAQSPKVDKIYIAPGNAGTSGVGENIDLNPEHFDALKDFVLENDVDIVVVGPEAPLVNGLHDYFSANNSLHDVVVVGPEKEAAKLEGSKEFAKQFMQRHGIPTAGYKSFTPGDIKEAAKYLETLSPPYVLKADGLAGGKGVLILDDIKEAKHELYEMLENEKFGKASNKIVIEEFLDGIELSVFALTDGKGYKVLPEAKDYKRIGEGGTGLNTGGMGAVSPVPFADEKFLKKVEDKIIRPTIEGLKKEQIEYQGFLFFGLMKVGDEPYVIEYNVRMGDPETEVVLPRIKSDIVEQFIAMGDNAIEDTEIVFDDKVAATVVLVSGGYPESYEKGKVIKGLEQVEGSILFHAGTKEDDETGQILTSGGRVIAITSYGNNKDEALKRCYANAEKIEFNKKFYRKDIGFDL